jgi:hypothetical protein
MFDTRAGCWFAGVIIGCAVACFVALAWPMLYAAHPWPGYENAAAQGLLSREYNSSPVALRDTIILLVAIGAVAGALARGPASTVVFLWVGVWSGLLASAFLWPQFRESNLWPLALVLYPLQALPFLLSAISAWALRRRLRSTRRLS